MGPKRQRLTNSESRNQECEEVEHTAERVVEVTTVEAVLGDRRCMRKAAGGDGGLERVEKHL